MGQRQAGASWLQALPKMQRVESSKWDVTAILVLCALPWLLTGSILAHEVVSFPSPFAFGDVTLSFWMCESCRSWVFR